jgi:hypothetical protein
MIDLMESSIKALDSISKHVKKSFLIVFVSMIVVFSFFLINFIPGREDWWDIFIKSPLFGWDVGQGRYFSGILRALFFDGCIGLPILGNMVTFFLLSLTSIMLCIYWKVPKNTISYSLVGLTLVLQPYILGAFFCLGYIENFFRLPFFIIVGFLLSEKVGVINIRYCHKVLLLVGSVLCFWFALGTYPLVINTIAVVFLGRLLIDFILSKDRKILNVISPHIVTIVVISIAVMAHYIVVSFLMNKGIMLGIGYNSGILSNMHDVILRCWLTAKIAVIYLYDYKLPFFPRMFTFMWTFLLFLACITSVYNFMQEKCKYSRRILNIIIMICLLFIILFSSLATNSISIGTTFFASHYDFFGIAFFHVFILVIIFNKHEKFVRNIGFLVSIIVLWICIVQNFNAQKVWSFGFEMEKEQWLRVINRIEMTTGFEADKSYTVLILGRTPSYRKIIYNALLEKGLPYLQGAGAGCILDYSFMADWGENNIAPLNKYSAYCLRGKWRQIVPGWSRETVESIKEELLKAKPWPHLSSVQIKDDTILIVFDNNALEATKNIIK